MKNSFNFYLRQTNYSFGYGFVNFVSEEGAQNAIKSLNGVSLRNKRLKVLFLFFHVLAIVSTSHKLTFINFIFYRQFLHLGFIRSTIW